MRGLTNAEADCFDVRLTCTVPLCLFILPRKIIQSEDSISEFIVYKGLLPLAPFVIKIGGALKPPSLILLHTVYHAQID